MGDHLRTALNAIAHLEAAGHPYADEARRLLSLPPEHRDEIGALASSILTLRSLRPR